MTTRFFGAFIFTLSAALGSTLYAVDPADDTQTEYSRSDRKQIAASTYDYDRGALTSRFQFPGDATGGTFGIDVSHFNGDIDWNKVAAAGVKFVYIKASQGKDTPDDKFETNWTGAKAAGLKVGAYHFLSALDTAKEQADYFLKIYEAEDVQAAGKADLPPVLDVEWDFTTAASDGHQTDRWSAQKNTTIAATVQGWLTQVAQATEQKPVIYTNTDWWNARIGSAGADLAGAYDLWISDYTQTDLTADKPVAPDGFTVVLWQFTDRGGADGVSGPLDTDLNMGLTLD